MSQLQSVAWQQRKMQCYKVHRSQQLNWNLECKGALSGFGIRVSETVKVKSLMLTKISGLQLQQFTFCFFKDIVELKLQLKLLWENDSMQDLKSALPPSVFTSNTEAITFYQQSMPCTPPAGQLDLLFAFCDEAFMNFFTFTDAKAAHQLAAIERMCIPWHLKFSIVCY